MQEDALDAVLDGDDAIIQAKTGSGKTLTYMLPLLAALRPQSSVQALVLLPTASWPARWHCLRRRLAAASPERLLVMALLDGSGAKRQRKWLVAQPPQVVVGNVQQVDAVLRSRLLRLDTLKLLVVDEVDACLADEQTSQLLERMLGGQLAVGASQQHQREHAEQVAPQRRRQKLEGRQTLFVSATLPQRRHFQKQCTQQRWCREPPRLIHAEPTETLPAQLVHGWAPCSPAKRVAALKQLLRHHEPHVTGAIVFVLPSMPRGRIAEAIGGILDDATPSILAEDEPLTRRAAAMRDFRERRRRLLVSTPMGARGLDVPHCSHVYLLGLPESAEAYLHAAGRCGRNGQPGRVTIIASDKEEFALRRIANALNVEFTDARELPGTSRAP